MVFKQLSLGAFFLGSHLYAAELEITYPKKPALPLTTRSLCMGIEKFRKFSHPDKQDIDLELSILCNGNEPTALLDSVVARPYDGNPNANTEDYVFQPIIMAEPAGYAVVTMVYALSIPKTTDRTIVGEEFIMKDTSYQAQDGSDIALQIRFDFSPTESINLGASYSQFKVSQTTYRTATPAAFKDQSEHEVRLYQLFLNNFDFLLSGRHLLGPGDKLYKRCGVVIAAMPNPARPDHTISINVMNMVMRNFGEKNERVAAIFKSFVLQHVKDVYMAHLKYP